MRNADQWIESKYVWRRGQLIGSRDPAEVGIGSRLIADCVAAFYAQQLPLVARGRLIDLGCGKAPLYGLYCHYVDSVMCVDWPHSAHASPYLDRAIDLSQQLPFPNSSFDTVLLSDVLEHVPAPEKLWQEIARVLTPGGHLLMNVPFIYGVHEAPHDYARFTNFALRRFARDAGLEVTVLESVGGSLHVLADLLAKHLVHVPLLGVPFARAVQGVVSLADRTNWGRRFAKQTAAHFPLGYFLVARRPRVLSQ